MKYVCCYVTFTNSSIECGARLDVYEIWQVSYQHDVTAQSWWQE